MTRLLSRSLLLVAWVAALAGAIAITFVYNGQSTSFAGIADDQEQTVRFTAAVEILSYSVVPGQQVSPGDPVITVRRPDLDADLGIANEKMQALLAENREVRASMEAEIVQERAELQAILTDFDAKIGALTARRDAATGLFAELAGGASRQRADPYRDQLASLEAGRDASKRSAESKIANLAARLQDGQRPINAEIAEVSRRIEEIDRQRKSLTQTAQFQGQVGSVLFRTGETVPPFQPLLTIHGSQPSFIKGFIHENVRSDVQISQQVWVSPSQGAGSGERYRGVVVSLGSRIVEFPDRLKVSPIAQAWGREVVVRLDSGHSLLLGERVQISLEQPIVLNMASLAGIFE